MHHQLAIGGAGDDFLALKVRRKAYQLTMVG